MKKLFLSLLLNKNMKDTFIIDIDKYSKLNCKFICPFVNQNNCKVCKQYNLTKKQRVKNNEK